MEADEPLSGGGSDPGTATPGEGVAGAPGGPRRPWSRWPAVIPEAGGPAPVEEPPPKPRSLLRELPLLLGVAFVIAFLVKTFVAQAFFIPSESMVHTLEVGDRVLVSRMSYRLHEPRRGDVVVFTSPFDTPGEEDDDDPLPSRVLHTVLESVGLRQPSTEDFIKRVIALPGETVEGRGGTILINGRALAEPYLAEPGAGDFPPTTIGENEVWVMGDNRNRSSDSRVFGPINESKIVGRAILRIWPVNRLGFL
ncbi:MAG TPA: signal peptidase I [Acidimicrobiia bacterium]|nr:signal peptidase I [Acidimicrobiia bacterium]